MCLTLMGIPYIFLLFTYYVHCWDGHNVCINVMGILYVFMLFAWCVHFYDGHTVYITLVGIPYVFLLLAHCVTVMVILSYITMRGILRVLLWIRNLIATHLNLDERT